MPSDTVRMLTVVGARPQFIKAAMVSRAIRERGRTDGPAVEERLVHTGQHYDDNMSGNFFEELDIPRPAVNLGIGSGGHGAMTGRMLEALETAMIDASPDLVLVYGDTNSTLAGALAAVKLHLPVAHVEAGLRSYNRAMPEEINRILTDRISSLLFCPTNTAVRNLAGEGINEGVRMVGDVMYDAAIAFGSIAQSRSAILSSLRLAPRGFFLATVHRSENTDIPERLLGILTGLGRLSRRHPVVFPIHPRTRKTLLGCSVPVPEGIIVIEPVSYLDMIALEKNAAIIFTDSGGVQKEAYFHGVPCVTLREETEWVETVECGWNALAGADPDRIEHLAGIARPGRHIAEYGDGHAAERIVQEICSAGKAPR